MPVAIKSLATNDLIAGTSDASVDTVYAAINVTAQINAATAYNSHTGAVLLSIYIVPFGGSAADVEPVAVQSLPNGESTIITDLLGHVVPKGGGIFAFAGTTDVVRLTLSGIEIT